MRCRSLQKCAVVAVTGPDEGGRSLSKRLSQVVLWAGLVLAALALWRLMPDLSAQRDRIGGVQLAGWILLMFFIWGCSVAAWRAIVTAFFGQPLPWSSAMRQTGLLLVGKYLPGGVFGWLARAYDGQGTGSRQRHLAAGAYEQLAALFIISSTGALFLAASWYGIGWLAGLILLPGLVSVGARLGARWLAHWPLAKAATAARALLAAAPTWPRLGVAAVWSQLGVLGWMLLVVWLALVVFQQPTHAALGLAGAFGLAVVIGIATIVVPGGVGVRESAFVALAVHWLGLADAVAFAALLRILSSLLDCGAGLAAFFLRGKPAIVERPQPYQEPPLP